MMDEAVDIAVLGSGFGGSLTALLLTRCGFKTALIDRAAHPRFAIGESSTPLADLALKDLCRAYDVPSLESLSRYGTWQQVYPEVVCGLKRGFSYFWHRPEHDFEVYEDHGTELLVTASSDDWRSDTNWLRADVDQLMADEASRSGVLRLDGVEIAAIPEGDRWLLKGYQEERSIRIASRFVVDATGGDKGLLRSLNIPVDRANFRTKSRALFGHFKGVLPWRDVLAFGSLQVEDHPFHCDHAAQHHILEEGWMWQLRFNNDVTSAGFALDDDVSPLEPDLSTDQEWVRLLERYPSLNRQFGKATLVQPPEGLQRTGRLQRRATKMAGPNWVVLPNTAGFIDPLHSTGIAQTLFGIERLVAIVRRHWGCPAMVAHLRDYEHVVAQELDFIDELVSGCYRARRHFRLFAAFSMLYFVAAITCEHRRVEKKVEPGTAFLCADDGGLRHSVRTIRRELDRVLGNDRIDEATVYAFEEKVASAIEPYNIAGLCDRNARNMYHYTAAPKP